MARPALTEEQRREIRHKIRTAAASLHNAHGTRNISARAIAEAAGVSVGTIYSHFGNLTELLQSLWIQPARNLIESMREVAHTTADPELRLRRLIEAYVQFAEDNWSVYKGAFMFVRPDEQPAPPRLELEKDQLFTMLKQAITDGQEQGVFRQGDVNAITQTLWSGVHGALALPTNFHRLALNDATSRVDQMIELLFDWLTAVTKH